MKVFILVLCCVTLSGCGSFGPSVIRSERANYNEAVHYTSAEQLLLNIVRTRNYEAPSFSDFVEYDSTPSATFGVSGGSTTIGAIPTLGIISPNFTAGESALQKNVSVTGAQLTQQIASPITLQSIRRLSFASEPNVPLYRFSFIGLGPFVDYNRVVHLIDFLDTYGALDIDARTPNTMTISLRTGVLDLYSKNKAITEDNLISCLAEQNNSRESIVNHLWSELKSIFPKTSGERIVLRTSDASMTIGSQNELDIAQESPQGSLVFTQTALGALRQTRTDGHTFQFLSPDIAERLRAENKANIGEDCVSSQFNISLPSINSPESVDEVWHKLFKFPFEGIDKARLDSRIVGSRTALLIIEESSDRPQNAYVSI